MEKITLTPAHIRSNLKGYCYLCTLNNQLLKYNNASITIDFSRITFFEANLCALLGVIFEQLENKGNTVILENISNRISNILRKNAFLLKYGYSTLIDSYDTSLQYERLNPNEDHRFKEYVVKQLLSKQDFPSHSNLLGDRIVKSIFELYENARTHGRCSYIHICGQFFPKAAKKPLHFTIVDKGITIKENVNSFLGTSFSATQAIEWAMISGNTTKKGETGGLGLGIIFDFVKMNKGKIHILSADGYYEYTNNQVLKHTLSYPFEGTLVNLTFDLTDEKHYMLKEETENLENIF